MKHSTQNALFWGLLQFSGLYRASAGLQDKAQDGT